VGYKKCTQNLGVETTGETSIRKTGKEMGITLKMDIRGIGCHGERWIVSCGGLWCLRC
jgi:hypothetical protein